MCKYVFVGLCQKFCLIDQMLNYNSVPDGLCCISLRSVHSLSRGGSAVSRRKIKIGAKCRLSYTPPKQVYARGSCQIEALFLSNARVFVHYILFVQSPRTLHRVGAYVQIESFNCDSSNS